jgi:hypothetical protein
MHFVSDGYDIDALHNAIVAHWTSNMLSHMTNENRVLDITYTPLDGSAGSVTKTLTNAAPWIGTITSGETVPQVATLVSLKTGFRGRSARGRIYLPFTAEGALNNGSLVGTVSTSMNAGWSAFRTAMIAAGHDLEVASYKNASANTVSDITVEQLLATQRLRQPRPSS